MVSSNEESPIYNIKLSSVGPAKVTGQDAIHDPTSMDLAMKLHYLKGVYYFRSEAFQGFTIMKIKETMFNWLNDSYVTCGRFRRSDSGRPYIKCNDCGVRLIEAQCNKTMDEWLETKLQDASLHKLLVPNQAIGPELPFSPMVLIQLTKFKCGGASVGISWAHVLGDASFAAEFLNLWGRVIAGHVPSQPLQLAQSLAESKKFLSKTEDPLSLKRVDPVGDHWLAASNCKMETFSFHISASQLSHLQSKICGGKGNHRIPPFESLCAAIWQCIAKVTDGSEPKVVTICKSDPNKGILKESQVVSVVEANFSIIEASPKELGVLLTNQAVNELTKIEETMERDHGVSDFIIFGANLTFVDFEDVPFYELDVNGQKPVYVSYAIDGVGEEGVVLVMPEPRDAAEGGAGGRIVSITLPENQVLELKAELKREWSIA